MTGSKRSATSADGRGRRVVTDGQIVAVPEGGREVMGVDVGFMGGGQGGEPAVRARNSGISRVISRRRGRVRGKRIGGSDPVGVVDFVRIVAFRVHELSDVECEV